MNLNSRDGLSDHASLLSNGLSITRIGELVRGVSEAVGDGCRSALNSCSGHGACDYCLNRCECMDGFGSTDDVNRLSPILSDKRTQIVDCSGRVRIISPPVDIVE